MQPFHHPTYGTPRGVLFQDFFEGRAVDLFHHQAGKLYRIDVATSQEKIAVGGNPRHTGLVQMGKDGGFLFKKFQGFGGGFDQDF